MKILDSEGKSVYKKDMTVTMVAFDRSSIPAEVKLPKKPGGYLMVAEFSADGKKTVLSRRFIKVGKIGEYRFLDLQPEKLK